MKNPIVILGSSRSFGETYKAIQTILGEENKIDIVDLNTLYLLPYDYEYRNQEDDYAPLMEKITQHDLIVLATPVYWYTMSAQMKIFIDRLSDLLEIKKELGQKMRGKCLFVIASFNTSLPRGFEEAFSQTCEYMGIKYEGCSFIYWGNDPELLKENSIEIDKARKFLLG